LLSTFVLAVIMGLVCYIITNSIKKSILPKACVISELTAF